MKKAVILLSGGLDSSTCLAVAKAEGFECHALSFHYGQKNSAELQAAQRIAKYFETASHRVLQLPLGQLGGSALTDAQIQVPDSQETPEVPSTYVPARNTIFLSMALGLAEVLGADDIFIGVSAVDYSGYPDCRPEYIASFQKMANLATKASVTGAEIKIHTPLIDLSKAQTIALGIKLGVNYAYTVTCYQASFTGKACGRCDSCVLRKKGFAQAGVEDPTEYI